MFASQPELVAIYYEVSLVWKVLVILGKLSYMNSELPYVTISNLIIHHLSVYPKFPLSCVRVCARAHMSWDERTQENLGHTEIFL